MQGTRIMVVGPTDSGPTGPSKVCVLAVSPVGTHINLADPQYATLAFAAQYGVPLAITSENVNVYYHWSSVATGLAADPNATVLGPTGANQSAVIFAGQAAGLPEMPPPGSQGLCVRAAAGGTAMMRLSRIG
jgi:hypothetical protein